MCEISEALIVWLVNINYPFWNLALGPKGLSKRGIPECGLTVDCLLGLENKLWDYFCHILICMVKTIVHSLGFTLTTFKNLVASWPSSLPRTYLVLSPLRPREHKRPLDSRTRRNTSMRFDLKFFCIFSNYRHPRKLHCTSFSPKN